MVAMFFYCLFFLMIRRPPRSTRTDTLFPYTTLFRSVSFGEETINKRKTRNRVIAPASTPPPQSRGFAATRNFRAPPRSEEHTSELQSLMRISYAVFCLKKKKIINTPNTAKPPRSQHHTLTHQTRTTRRLLY